MGEKKGLAKKIAALGNLTKLESALDKAIESSKVPESETRKLLKATNPNQVKNTAVFQFMRKLFDKIGLGKITVKEKDIFKLVFYNEDCAIKNLYPDVEDKKTCYIVSDALEDFFSVDLNMPAEVKETACENVGDNHCVFEIDLQPLAVYRIALDAKDDKIIEAIKKGEDLENLPDELGLPEAQIDYRTDILRSYHVLNDDLNLTKIGQTYHKYGKSVIEEEKEEKEPPWETMSMISGDIADSASFAEAIVSSDSTTEASEGEEIDKSNVVNLADEADKSKSFAQLVSKHIEDEEE